MAKRKGEFSVESTLKHDNLIVKNHRVHDVSILPGVTFLDMIHRLVRKYLDADCFDLKNVLFSQPLATSDQFDRNLLTSFYPEGSGKWRVLISSKRVKEGVLLDDKIDIHAECLIDINDSLASTAPTFDIKGFIDDAKYLYGMDAVYGRAQSLGITHEGFMRTEGDIYQGNDGELMVLRLADIAESVREKFIAPPAFLDSATFAGLPFYISSDSQHAYIPFAIKKFSLYGEFPSEIYVYTEKNKSTELEKELDFFERDICVYNKEGVLLAEFLGISAKKIREAESIENLIEDFTDAVSSFDIVDDIPVIPAVGSSSKDNILEYLSASIGAVLKKQPSEIDQSAGFYELGLASNQLLDLTKQLERKCGHEFYPTLLFEHQTIDELADYLFENDGSVFGDVALKSDLSLKSTRQETSERLVSKANNDPIAIVGLSGRYPEAENIQSYWDNLASAKDCIREVPLERWDHQKYFSQDKLALGKTYSKWGGFVDDYDKFDPLFFNISPRMAEKLDPQARLFLETCWQTVEDAGYKVSDLKGRSVGVYAGVFWTQYQLYGGDESSMLSGILPDSFISNVTNLVSYQLGLKGPSVALDTQCSSSLTAIHLACESIRNGESELALAGGVNLMTHPNKYLWLSQAQFLSDDGKCRAFGEGGNGYVPGEGVGCILLKPLSKAQQDGDHIYGVIEGSAINHGGRSAGYSVPNVSSQSEVVELAINRSGIDSKLISYIEAHGTGTELGDPIEVSALNKIYRTDRNPNSKCYLGSVKSNIGHCESAAGIAGLTKVLLQLKHKKLVASLHAERLNNKIDFANTPFEVNRKLSSWENESNHPRYAAISSFGAGGSNAHMIISEYVDTTQILEYSATFPVIIPLSAQSQEQLAVYANTLLSFLIEQKNISIKNMAYTLQIGREPMNARVAFVVNTKDGLIEQLTQFLQGEKLDGCYQCDLKQDKENGEQLILDEQSQVLLEKSIAEKNLQEVARLWTKGMPIDWLSLYEGDLPRRVSLPTYPFAKERYWIPRPEIDASVERIADEEAVASCFYQEAWEAQTLSATSIAGLSCLYLGHDTLVDSTFLTQANEVGIEPCIRVEPADQFEQRSSHHFAMPVENEAGYRELFAQLSSSADLIKSDQDLVCIHRWSQGQSLAGVQALFSLLKVAKESALPLRRLVIVGDLSAEAAVSSYEQSWIGLERSLQQLMPSLSITVVYSDQALSASTLLMESSQRGVVRYQSGQRSVLALNEVAVPPSQETVLREGGVYLITGGAGELGSALAFHLAKTYKAHIILVGRRATTPTIETLLTDLQSAGATDALYRSVDVSDQTALRVVVDEVMASYGQLHGVIHGAGVSSGVLFMDKSADAIEAALSAKTVGSVAIDEATAHCELDFLCYFSSTSALLGDLGECDYAMGNRFQMAYGVHRQDWVEAGKRTGQTLVVNWPLWDSSGMQVADEEQLAMYLKSSGQVALSITEGMALWERLLSQSIIQCGVFIGYPRRIDDFLQRRYGAVVNSTASLSRLPSLQLGRRAAFTSQPLEAHIKADVVSTLSALLKVDSQALDPQTNLVDFGMDSVLLNELTQSLNTAYGIDLVPSVFFSYGTIEKLTQHLAQSHSDVLTPFYETSEVVETKASDDHLMAATPPSVSHPALHSPRPAVALDEPIAVVGLSGRFPQADTVDELWELLASGGHAVSDIPAERWDWRDYFTRPGDPSNQVTTNQGGFLRGVDEFDPLFFEISPKEAEGMDPKQRLLLQEAWRALEDAGYMGDQIKGASCGVFVGVEESEYASLATDETLATGNHNGILAARISYFLDLRGPNLAINTACSSSLVALHQACQSLRQGECDMALAAGVNVMLSPYSYKALTRMGMLSEQGACRTFDNDADGMVPGEAAVVVVLKPLSHAERDGDHIYGTIKATGVNYDGKTNGLTAPNGLSQEALLASIYQRQGLDVSDMDYLIAHGTGTKLGDPVEVNALTAVFSELTQERQYCALGSTKTNVGHTFAASGLVSVVSLLMGMKHQQIPASLHCEQENTYIDFANSPFYVNKTTVPWVKAAGSPRLGATSAFGMSGTNAHVVVEEYCAPLKEEAVVLGGHGLIPLSAKMPEQLSVMVQQLSDFLAKPASRSLALADVAYSLQVGREAMPYRLMLAADSVEKLSTQLQSYLSKGASSTQSCWEGEVTSGDDLSRLMADEDMQQTLEQWLAKHKVHQLAELWLKGVPIDWARLYSGRPQRVSLPTYPFAKEQYWLPAINTTATASARLHPLVHENTSTLSVQRFSSEFTGKEFFFNDHHVLGAKVLPGVAYLEMARVAVEQSGAGVVQRIEDVVWANPLRHDGDRLSVDVELLPGDGIDYKVVTQASGVHGLGRVIVGDVPTEAPY